MLWQPRPRPRPPPLLGCGTTVSGGPMHKPSCQGRARPLLLAAQLQPLLTNTARPGLAVPISSWQMHSSALPLTLQPRLPVCGASNPGQGVSPPTCHATLGGTPDASCFSRSCVRPSFFGPVAPMFACWSAGTRLIFATAAANLLSVRLWTSPSCSEPTRASFGKQLAFQICCCLKSCMIQQLGTLSSAS